MIAILRCQPVPPNARKRLPEFHLRLGRYTTIHSPGGLVPASFTTGTWRHSISPNKTQNCYAHYIQDKSTGGLVVDLLGSHHRTQMKTLRVRPSNIFKIVLGKGVVGLPVACCQDLVQRNATLKSFGSRESSNIMSFNLLQS